MSTGKVGWKIKLNNKHAQNHPSVKRIIVYTANELMVNIINSYIYLISYITFVRGESDGFKIVIVQLGLCVCVIIAIIAIIVFRNRY